jgi:two-component system, sensor histidine kinase LadS
MASKISQILFLISILMSSLALAKEPARSLFIVPKNQDLSIPDLSGRVKPSERLLAIAKSWGDEPAMIAGEFSDSLRLENPVREIVFKLVSGTEGHDKMLGIIAKQVDYAEFAQFVDGELIGYGVGGLKTGSQGINLLTRTPIFYFKSGDKPDIKEEIYIRIVSLGTSSVHFKLKLYFEMIQDLEISRAIIYFFLGAILLVFVYQLVIFVGLNQTAILWYIAFILTFTVSLVFTSGFLDYFLPTSSRFHFAHLGPFSSGLIGVFAIMVADRFLNLHGKAHKVAKLAMAISIVLCGFGLFYILDPQTYWLKFGNFVIGLQLLTTFAVVSVVLLAVYLKYENAKLLLLAWLPLAVFIVLDVTRIIPYDEVYSGQLIHIPVLLEVLIMAYVMSVKTRSFSDKIAQNQNLRHLLKVLSHDIQNYLHIVTAHTDLINRKTDGMALDQSFKKIHNAVTRASEILKTLRIWLNYEDQKSNLNLDKVKIASVIRSAIYIYEDKAISKDIKVEFNCPPEMLHCEVWAVEVLVLNQVINNALSNAIKFSNRGGKVDISIEIQNSYLVVNIADFGSGIPKESVELINRGDFVNSTPGTEQEKGTGFGTMLMFNFMKFFGGKIQIESKVKQEHSANAESGSGTIVHLYFKLV